MKRLAIMTILLVLGLTSILSAAKKTVDVFSDQNVVEADEVLIKVEPELPTVIVTPNRQPPTMTASTLKPSLKDMVLDTTSPVKPSLQKLTLKKVEGPNRIYRKDRQVQY